MVRDGIFEQAIKLTAGATFDDVNVKVIVQGDMVVEGCLIVLGSVYVKEGTDVDGVARFGKDPVVTNGEDMDWDNPCSKLHGEEFVQHEDSEINY